ncbi:MAG: hypothetical protein AAFW73_25815 [Bacteroidota bacterium]
MKAIKKALIIDLEESRRENLGRVLAEHRLPFRSYAQVGMAAGSLERETALERALDQIEPGEILFIHASERQRYAGDLVHLLYERDCNLVLRYGGAARTQTYKGGRIWDLPWAMPPSARVDWDLAAFIRAVELGYAPADCFDVLLRGSRERREWRDLLDGLRFQRQASEEAATAGRYPHLFANAQFRDLWRNWMRDHATVMAGDEDRSAYWRALEHLREQSQNLIQ